jgi:hypothetical protein
VLKTAKRQVMKDTEISEICDHIRRVFVAYERSTPSETIRAAWRRTGFDYVRSEGEWKLHVKSEKLDEFSEFTDVWSRDYPEEGISSRRLKQAWIWVNEKFFPTDFIEQFEYEDTE